MQQRLRTITYIMRQKKKKKKKLLSYSKVNYHYFGLIDLNQLRTYVKENSIIIQSRY